VEVVASLSQGRTAAAQCGLFTYKSVPVIFEPPCNNMLCCEASIKLSTTLVFSDKRLLVLLTVSVVRVLKYEHRAL